jgi:hypothetical protein
MFSTILPLLAERFAAVSGSCSHSFFGLIPWYQYLNVSVDPLTGHCEIKNFNTLGGNSSFLLIGLAILDDLLRVAALVAVGYVIYGGFNFMTSEGSPENTKSARTTVLNALVGLVIAMFAATIVAFLGNRLGGP